MAILIAPEDAIGTGDDDYLEGVADFAQWAVFLLAFFIAIHSEGRLNAVAPASLVGHEILL